MMIEAPFTPEQVATMNLWQELPFMHPYTCRSGNRMDEHHKDGEGRLVATTLGWRCPYCDYTQNWAHSHLGDLEALRRFINSQRILKSKLSEEYLDRVMGGD